MCGRFSCNTFEVHLKKILHFSVKMWHLKEMKEKVLHMSSQSKEYFIATEKKVLHMWSFSSDLKHLNMDGLNVKS